MNKKIYISWLLVIIWMMIIFFFSTMTGDVSTSISEKAIQIAIEKVDLVAKKSSLENNKINNSKKITTLSKKLNYPVRKILHITEYFILTILLINAFYQSRIKINNSLIYSLIICFIYACTDELHQLFTGRTCLFTDILIDSFGGIIAIIFIIVLKKIKYNKIQRRINTCINKH